MKWKIGIGSILLLLLFGVWIGFHQLQQKGWEKMLAGPYDGLVFTGEIQTNIASAIALNQDFSIEAHQVTDGNDGKIAVLLRHDNQSPAWMRLLVIQVMDPKATNQSLQTYLRNVSFKRVTNPSQQYKVYMTCDVGMDTNEGGIIYINKDFQFTGFSVSW